jgi:hypothetical protein
MLHNCISNGLDFVETDIHAVAAPQLVQRFSGTERHNQKSCAEVSVGAL